MIKCDKGKVKIEGTGYLILSELSTLVHELHYGVFVEKCGATPEESKEDILEAVERGFKTDEEMRECAKDTLKDVLTDLSDLLNNILSGKDDE